MCRPCSDAVNIHASLAINHFDEDAILWCQSDAYNGLQGNLKKMMYTSVKVEYMHELDGAIILYR